jgi:hypothetical protein
MGDSVVGSGYGLDDREVGVRVPVGSRIVSSLRRPDRFWGPSNLLSKGYKRLFPGGKAAGGVYLTIDLQLVPRSRKCGTIHFTCYTCYLIYVYIIYTRPLLVKVQYSRSCPIFSSSRYNSSLVKCVGW